MAKNEVETISPGMMYGDKKNKDDKVVVIMWNNDVVLYAPEGSGREFRLSSREFLDRFELLPNEPVVTPSI